MTFQYEIWRAFGLGDYVIGYGNRRHSQNSFEMAKKRESEPTQALGIISNCLTS